MGCCSARSSLDGYLEIAMQSSARGKRMRKEVIGNATLYLGDCLQILPREWLDYQAVLTDPPYGTGWVRGGGAVGEFNAKHEKPDWDVFSIHWIKLVRSDVIAAFCAPSYLHRMCTAFRAPCIARYK